jgi:hypothetical protein
MFHVLNRIDRKLRERVEHVARTAAQFGEQGVTEWAERAARDAVALGHLRERDVRTLERLEDTFSHDFYRGNCRSGSDPIYA